MVGALSPRGRVDIVDAAGKRLGATPDPRHERPRGLARRHVIGVHDDVVANALVDPLRLVARHADVPVRSFTFTSFSNRGLTAYADPDDGQPLERVPQSSLRSSAGEEDFVDDDADPGTRHRRQTLVPGCLGATERIPDDNGAVGPDLE
jgi:hypothetical protein